MSWIKLSDDWAVHPKFTDPGTGALCQLLHARSLCYAGRYLTDGFIPASVVPTLLAGFDTLGLINGMRGQDALELNWPDQMVQSKLWIEAEGGWTIHDYLTYNPSKTQVETARKLQSRGGQHSQVIQQSKRYLQSQPQSSAKVGLQLSPVPVSEKKEKKRLEEAVNTVDKQEVPRPPFLASPDRESRGFESVGMLSETIKQTIPEALRDEIEADLIVRPESS